LQMLAVLKYYIYNLISIVWWCVESKAKSNFLLQVKSRQPNHWQLLQSLLAVCSSRQILCWILKDSDLLDRRKHCFSVQSESGEDLYFSVELESDLTLWEKAFQTATFLEVERIQSKTYACVLESHLMGLTIDFSMGFVCFDAATKVVLWRYKFSQLKGSSDDGKSKIKFLFQNQDTKQIEAKELEFSNLFAVLHCIHSFFAAKVACLDPLYVGSKATASAAPTTSGTGKLKYTT
ncbi:PREDICTED: gamma-1-syntrophin-like, partial [Apaloderma vittatum]|uniref:gamma-1-syntrophin-like n=1 Tax=Apaloderma vittatum TaxID=57397 RepID=UPI0005218F3B